MTSQNPLASPPPITVAASLIPKIPPTAPIPARMTVTPVSRFMITDRPLLTCVRYTSSVLDASSRSLSSSSARRIAWS